MAMTTIDTTRTGCPATVNGSHNIEWVEVPPMVWVGGSDFGGQDVPAMRRGFCWDCDERFTDGK